MTVEVPHPGWSRELRRRGALVLAAFGLPWGLVAVSGMRAGPASAARVAAVVLTGAALLLAVTPSRALGRAGEPERVRHQPDGWRRRVGTVNLAQLAAIVIAVVLLVGAAVPQLVPPVVCLVVGLHFVPLARLFDQPEYRSTAAGLMVGAAAGLAVLATGGSNELSRVVVGTTAAGTLWATSAWLSLRG